MPSSSDNESSKEGKGDESAEEKSSPNHLPCFTSSDNEKQEESSNKGNGIPAQDDIEVKEIAPESSKKGITACYKGENASDDKTFLTISSFKNARLILRRSIQYASQLDIDSAICPDG
jgi:hypothetical protein